MRKFNKQRKESISANSQANDNNKIPIPDGPSSFKEFCLILSYHVFKKPLFVSIEMKVVIYAVGVTLGSVVFDIFRAPPTYLSNKYNFFNQILVKWGWGWTCSLLAFFIVSSSFVYTGGSKTLMRWHLMRLLVGSMCWLVSTNIFNMIENSTGSCYPTNSHSQHLNRRSCQHASGTWIGIDISGHTFLLIMCNLWILEETKCMRHWPRIGQIVMPNSDNPQARSLDPDELNKLRASYKRLTGIVKAVAVALSLLSVVWDLMLIATVVYFHNMPTKFAGMVMALLCWFLSYRCWFSSKILSPGLPGDGIIKYML